MKVIVKNRQKDLSVNAKQVKLLAAEVVKHEMREYDEVSISLVNAQCISEMHEQYFNDPTQTDCISFPMEDEEDENYRLMGDIFVCPKTAIEYSAKHALDPYRETSLYIVHGLLHLMGYDDIEKYDRTKMRAAERRHMGNLEFKDLILKPI